jgi:hypothetical protein
VRSRSLAAAALLALALPAAASAGAERVSGCSATTLRITVAHGTNAAGSAYYSLRFTNLGSAACSLFGYPGVSAVTSAGRLIGVPAGRNPQHAPRLVVLRRGSTASAIVRITDTGVFPPAACRARAAFGLRVYPPGSFASKVVRLSFRACSTARSSLAVEAVA